MRENVSIRNEWNDNVNVNKYKMYVSCGGRVGVVNVLGLEINEMIMYM